MEPIYQTVVFIALLIVLLVIKNTIERKFNTVIPTIIIATGFIGFLMLEMLNGFSWTNLLLIVVLLTAIIITFYKRRKIKKS